MKKINLETVKNLSKLRLTFDIDLPLGYIDENEKVRRENKKTYDSVIDAHIPNEDLEEVGNDIEDIIYIYCCRYKEYSNNSDQEFLNRLRDRYPHLYEIMEI